MPSRSRINPHHASQRGAARVLGGILLAAGGIFCVVGFVDFIGVFGSAGGSGPPTKFWCLFVGLPLVGFGVMLLKLGYLGAVSRYVAGEAAPVVKDTFDYLADGTKDGVRELARAAGEGLRGERTDVATCAVCGESNAAVAKFCDECGSPLGGPRGCAACGGDNDADARFCRHCGKAIAGRV